MLYLNKLKEAIMLYLYPKKKKMPKPPKKRAIS